MKFTFKIGQRVAWTRISDRLTGTGAGRVAGSDRKVNGEWVSVNVAPKGQNAKLIRIRAKQLWLAA